MAYPNLTVRSLSGVADASLTFIGGRGDPQNPSEWRETSGKPLFAQVSLLSSVRRLKGNIDQVVHHLRVPYTVTNTETSQEEPVSYAECTLTYNLPRNVPQTVVDLLVGYVATAEWYKGTDSNLALKTAARQPS